MNGAVRGYVHRGTAFLQKKLFSVVRGTNYEGVRWFIDAVMQIKATQGRGLHPPKCHFKRDSILKQENEKDKRISISLDFTDQIFCKWYTKMINHGGVGVANDGGGSCLAAKHERRGKQQLQQ